MRSMRIASLVIHVDDDSWELMRVRDLLEQSNEFVVVSCLSVEEGEQAAKEFQHAIVILGDTRAQEVEHAQVWANTLESYGHAIVQFSKNAGSDSLSCLQKIAYGDGEPLRALVRKHTVRAENTWTRQ